MMGPHRIPVTDLRVGDLVDVEDDEFIDPPEDRDGGPSEFEFEYLVVESIEAGVDADTIVVEFDLLTAVLPTSHLVIVDRDALPARPA